MSFHFFSDDLQSMMALYQVKVIAEQIILLDIASMTALQPHHLLGDVSLKVDAEEIQRVKKNGHNVSQA